MSGKSMRTIGKCEMCLKKKAEYFFQMHGLGYFKDYLICEDCAKVQSVLHFNTHPRALLNNK